MSINIIIIDVHQNIRQIRHLNMKSNRIVFLLLIISRLRFSSAYWHLDTIIIFVIKGDHARLNSSHYLIIFWTILANAIYTISHVCFSTNFSQTAKAMFFQVSWTAAEHVDVVCPRNLWHYVLHEFYKFCRRTRRGVIVQTIFRNWKTCEFIGTQHVIYLSFSPAHQTWNHSTAIQMVSISVTIKILNM